MPPPSLTRRAAAGLLAAAAATPLAAQEANERAARPAPPAPPLPAKSLTRHVLRLGGADLRFSASAGALRLADTQSGAPRADLAYVAYALEGADARQRPIVFAFNGGPGYASGWLHLGGLGPWRLAMEGAAARPSASPTLVDNEDAWLAFADLVFIDPPGTGYSRALGGEDVRRGFWSVEGDVGVLAAGIRRYVEENGRGASPKFLAGESYGGFRAPKIAHLLGTDLGIGIDGIVMISPALEIGQAGAAGGLFAAAGLLPSLAAVARGRERPATRADLADVEAYARGDYLVDLARGVNDPAALERASARVAALSSLDPVLVRRLEGRVTASLFAREFDRAHGRVLSAYDGGVTGLDPDPSSTRDRSEDQLRVGLHAPITQAMEDLLRDRLDWRVENARYMFFNSEANGRWDYGRRPVEATSDLARDLALDPTFRALVATGVADLVTPYFATRMILDQMSDFGGRLRFSAYPSGHMIYIREGARKALAADARALVEGG